MPERVDERPGDVLGAPSWIRTCAHGSGGRQPNLTNLCGLPASTQLLPSRAAKIIPRIFRVMVGAACRQSAKACHIPSCRAICERFAVWPSLPLAVGRCCCCHRCFQARPGERTSVGASQGATKLVGGSASSVIAATTPGASSQLGRPTIRGLPRPRQSTGWSGQCVSPPG